MVRQESSVKQAKALQHREDDAKMEVEMGLIWYQEEETRRKKRQWINLSWAPGFNPPSPE
jgi:hypothetical protein